MGEVAYEQPSSPNQSDSEVSASSGEIEAHVAESDSANGNTNKQHICRWTKCDMIFNSLQLLAAHVSQFHGISGSDGLFYCGWRGCSRGSRGFNARYKMLVHVRTHTNEKPHHCFRCDKSFSRAENLKIHARSHTGERPYQCPIKGCMKAYSNSSDRFKHTRTHTIEKPYYCKVPGCPKRYTDPSSLRKHVKTYKHESVPQRDSPIIQSASVPPQLDHHMLQQQNQQTQQTFFGLDVPTNPQPANPHPSVHPPQTMTIMDPLAPLMPLSAWVPPVFGLMNPYCTAEIQDTPLDLTIAKDRTACF